MIVRGSSPTRGRPTSDSLIDGSVDWRLIGADG